MLWISKDGFVGLLEDEGDGQAICCQSGPDVCGAKFNTVGGKLPVRLRHRARGNQLQRTFASRSEG
ncbi:hypothetical protein ROE7235_03077 [Roseibaca ekhonensis]|uniref:Uncharacterized protein n=1 Tax=Roseinatronobacter ekhonensis TaxID=254356 RepID=A0A3B0MIC4_9RHOB|nr:hypothetical protein ROE7235_03077 [Roseibaca ekhonensis]